MILKKGGAAGDHHRQGIVAPVSRNSSKPQSVEPVQASRNTLPRAAAHEVAGAGVDQRLSETPLLTQAERHQVLVEWNDTAAAYPQDKCLHQLFEAQVARTPDAVAVICEDQRLTYRELNRRANQLAHYLRGRGVGPEVLVGLCMERSLAMVTALLGILKAGGAYVPLDPSYPEARLAFMLADSGVSILLTMQAVLAKWPAYEGTPVCLDADWERIAEEPNGNLDNRTLPDNLAYVIYTSGSTGTPKGVAIEHQGLVNYLHWCIGAYDVESGRGAPVHSSIAFDLTITGLFAPLLVGRTTWMLPEHADIEALSTLLQQETNFSLVKITPSHLRLLSQQLSPQEVAGRTRMFVIGGENLTAEMIAFWERFSPDTILINEYGPTETVVGCCVYRVPRTMYASGAIPIGRPIANTQLYILDPHQRPVAVGVPGELYIGGVGVARGYLNRPDLTAERFIPDPFSPTPGARLYKTGDLVRYLPDGTIEYFGRLDHQVKIRGFRIELGEIETALTQHPAVREALVLARDDAGGDTRLIAYVVPAPAPPSTRELRGLLQTRLPEYMVPSAFVFLKALPLTPNGKVDRDALPAPDAHRADADTEFIPPRSTLERELVAVWEEVMDVRPIGVEDNFFDLGGHSLLAVRLFARLEERFGKRLPVATLLHAPTITQLAALLVDDWPAQFSSVVPIQPTGARPPFFCVHGFGGNVIVFRELAHHLRSDDQPFYGLQARELDGVHAPFTSLEAMAAHYVAEMRAVQPEGPYYLGGYSDGALIAFEMARQLWASGQVVGLLAVLDGGAPGYAEITRTPAFMANFLANLPPAMGAFVKLGAREMVTRLGMHRRVLGKIMRARIARKVRRMDSEPPTAEIEYLLDVASALPPQVRQFADARNRALRNYRPPVYPGRITLLRAHAQPLFCSHDPKLEWGPLAVAGVDVHDVPGKHHTLLREPYVRAVAEKLFAVPAAAQHAYGEKNVS